MAKRKFGRKTAMQAFRRIANTVFSKRNAQTCRELSKKAVFIHHAAVHQRIHERLALVGGDFEGMAQAGWLSASGAGSGADENVDQSGGGHVWAIQRRHEGKVSSLLQEPSSAKKICGATAIVCYIELLYEHEPLHSCPFHESACLRRSRSRFEQLRRC